MIQAGILVVGIWVGQHAPLTRSLGRQPGAELVLPPACPRLGPSHIAGGPQLQLHNICQAEGMGPPSPQWCSHPIACPGCAEEAGWTQPQPLAGAEGTYPRLVGASNSLFAPITLHPALLLHTDRTSHFLALKQTTTATYVSKSHNTGSPKILAWMKLSWKRLRTTLQARKEWEGFSEGGRTNLAFLLPSQEKELTFLQTLR